MPADAQAAHEKMLASYDPPSYFEIEGSLRLFASEPVRAAAYAANQADRDAYKANAELSRQATAELARLAMAGVVNVEGPGEEGLVDARAAVKAAEEKADQLESDVILAIRRELGSDSINVRP